MRNLIFSILFLSTLLSYGQNDVLFGRFVNYTVDQGLSSSRTSCVAEDSLGFIWIGTEEGLNRFDGTNFKMFLKSSKEGSIPDNYITQLIPLPKGDLLGTPEEAEYLSIAQPPKVSKPFLQLTVTTSPCWQRSVSFKKPIAPFSFRMGKTCFCRAVCIASTSDQVSKPC